MKIDINLEKFFTYMIKLSGMILLMKAKTGIWYILILYKSGSLITLDTFNVQKSHFSQKVIMAPDKTHLKKL